MTGMVILMRSSWCSSGFLSETVVALADDVFCLAKIRAGDVGLKACLRYLREFSCPLCDAHIS